MHTTLRFCQTLALEMTVENSVETYF